jgi:peptidyl-prolyl cis-trans isomerase D
MALIGKIRNNSWILIVMIALGLGGFILMDMTSGQQSVFGSSQTTMAEINGTPIDINEFTRTEQVVFGGQAGDPFAQRNTIWNFYLDNVVVREEAAEIGLGVSKDELLDLQFGTNLSPIIQTRFRNQATGQVDVARLTEFQQAIQNNDLRPDLRLFWAHQENEIINDRLKTKMIEMASAAMFVPSWQAEMLGTAQSEKVDFLYVKVPFDAISDAEVTVAEEDFQAYLDENQATYTSEEETRRIAYTVFEVQATSADSALVREEVEALVDPFVSTTENEVFVQANFGAMDAAYYTRENLPASIVDTLFTMEPGTVYGPYEENGAYQLVKLIDRKIIPDSVKSRHILIRADQANPFAMSQALATVDSLKTLIEAGTHSFDSLALQFGSDGTASQGGDLGFAAPGGMVKPFNDLIFFTAEPGKLYSVETQFGAHLVEVTDYKYAEEAEESVQIAFVGRPIIPSEATISQLEREALDMLDNVTTLEELRSAVASRNDLDVTVSGAVTENEYFVAELGGGQATRDMIRWVFGNDPNIGAPELGALSPTIYRYQDQAEYFTNKYVIAGLESIRAAGPAQVEDVRRKFVLQSSIRRKRR